MASVTTRRFRIGAETMHRLTDRQRAVLDFLRDYQARHQRPPTRREVATKFHINVNAAQGHLLALEAKGVIQRDKGARALRLLNSPP